MNWLPPPDGFREQLAACAAATDPCDRLERLFRLAGSQLSYVQLTQLDTVLRRVSKSQQSRFEPVRLALLASNTVEHLLPAIRVGGLRHGLHVDTYVCPFGQYRQDLLSADSSLNDFKPDTILLSLAARDFFGGVSINAPLSVANEAIEAAVEDIRALWGAAARFGATVIQQSFIDTEPALFGALDAVVPGAPARLVAHLNARLADCASENRVLWLDIARAGTRDGLALWFDVVRWLQAKMEIAPNAAPAYGELLSRLIGAQRGKSKKCLVLDLDDTLWGGVIGDDGVGGITLGQGSGVGEAHLALQRYAKRLRERGVILAVCSKNDPAIAESAFSEHPEMLLRRADFAAFVANWDDKAANLVRIASLLNVGIESLVFVDDNPVERARVRSALPMVATPELPEDPALFVQRLSEAGYFEAAAFTAEDSQRAGQYAANADRDALRSSAGGIEGFLEQLEMSVIYGPVTPLELPRVTQLINKTNQFNTTTIRRTEQEVQALIADPQSIHLQFRLIDKFGDNGIVSAMLVVPDASGEGQLVNWVMSCRVFGRQLEHEAMNVLVETARQRGMQEIRADYLATAKNGVVKDLFAKLGFTFTQQLANGSRWALGLTQYVPHTTKILQRARHNG